MTNGMTLRAVKAQLQAMNASIFEVGAYKPSQTRPDEPEMLLRTWDHESLLRSVSWLRWQNLQGRNIYIRPRGEHGLSLLDDLTVESVERLKSGGFNPAVVVETSPGNFQAWVNHGQVLAKELSTKVAQALAKKFHGDPSSADWRHFGRLAGFTNRKEKYRSNDGLSPFVKVIEASGQVYPRAEEFLAEIRKAVMATPKAPRRAPIASSRISAQPLQSIEDFRNKTDYQQDGNRIDLAYAVYALSHRVAEGEVRTAIASRDLSHKGNEKRQADYIDRTIKKAWNIINGPGRGR